jgi:predicted DNA-binding ribbon-helix-helix protein
MIRVKTSVRTKDPRGKSLIVQKNVSIGKRQAGVYLEEPFWIALKEIAAAQRTSMARVIGKVESERRERRHKNLSSAVRLFILDFYRSRCGLERPEARTPSTATMLPPTG